MVTVEFNEVGRDKKSWTDTLPHLSASTLSKSVKRNRALMSRDIEFEFDQGEMSGSIIVGGMRPVGSWRVVKASDAN